MLKHMEEAKVGPQEMVSGHSESQEFKVKGHVFAFLSVLSRPIIVTDFL